MSNLIPGAVLPLATNANREIIALNAIYLATIKTFAAVDTAVAAQLFALDEKTVQDIGEMPHAAIQVIAQCGRPLMAPATSSGWLAAFLSKSSEDLKQRGLAQALLSPLAASQTR